MKNILFIIDEIELKYFEFNRLVTNFWLIKELLDRGFCVSISTKNRLMVENAEAFVFCFKAYEKNNDIFYASKENKKFVNDFDVVFFRPDPPVDIDYINACYVFDFVDSKKTLLINSPSAIKNFNEKFHLNYFSEFAPLNIVSSSKDEIRNFVKKNEEAIIKPLNRCFGSGVYYLKDGDKNLNSIISNLTNDGRTLVMVQKYLDQAKYGDKRVLMLGEHVFDECVMKLPGKNDFKFNTHSAEYFKPAILTPREKSAAQKIAQKLTSLGLYMVGLDVIDEYVIEINVTSPCYFIEEINAQNDTCFQDKLMEKLLTFIEYKTTVPVKIC